MCPSNYQVIDVEFMTALNSVPEVPYEAADKVRDVAGEDCEGDESLEQLGALGEVDEGQVAVVREPLHEVGGFSSYLVVSYAFGKIFGVSVYPVS